MKLFILILFCLHLCGCARYIPIPKQPTLDTAYTVNVLDKYVIQFDFDHARNVGRHPRALIELDYNELISQIADEYEIVLIKSFDQRSWVGMARVMVTYDIVVSRRKIDFSTLTLVPWREGRSDPWMFRSRSDWGLFTPRDLFDIAVVSYSSAPHGPFLGMKRSIVLDPLRDGAGSAFSLDWLLVSEDGLVFSFHANVIGTPELWREREVPEIFAHEKRVIEAFFDSIRVTPK